MSTKKINSVVPGAYYSLRYLKIYKVGERLFRREMNVYIYVKTKIGTDCTIYIVNDVGAVISPPFFVTIERVRTDQQPEFFRAFFTPGEETVLKLTTVGKTPLTYQGETGRGFEYGILTPITMVVLDQGVPQGEKRGRETMQRRPIGYNDETAPNKRRSLE
jgi:hypothetical protein